MADKLAGFDFSALVAAIRQMHEHLAAQVGKAVNISLTLRNWAIGCYVREYEQKGTDRVKYGESLLSSLSQQLEEAGVDGCASRSLRLYRQFYLTYPEIWQTVSAKSQRDFLPDPIWQLLSANFAEARQKRILIGDTHSFVDLVFYHRILKCHVLVELKIEAFTHENLGQLNTYVSWYRKNMMADGDNPPVGILLCTQKDHALVEYALAGMDNNLFVSKYQLELPKKEDIQRFLEEKMREVSGGW